MSATLARKIRRIGLVRTPHTQIVTTKDEQGNEVEATHTTYRTRRRYVSRLPLRSHRLKLRLSNEELRLLKAVTVREHNAAFMGSAAFLFWFRIGKQCDAAAKRAHHV